MRGSHTTGTSKLLSGETHSQPDNDGWVTVTYNKDADSDAANSDIDQDEILRRAFAGDDVEDEFEREKAAIVEQEDEKIVDNSLPGWGSWVGEGLSKRERQRNSKTKNLVRQAGIKANERKDAKLKKVIINEKRAKKNVGYLATQLPFPFTSRAEYERSIRMPIGSEWNAKQTFVENTKPKVMVRPGKVVLPIQKPII